MATINRVCFIPVKISSAVIPLSPPATFPLFKDAEFTALVRVVHDNRMAVKKYNEGRVDYDEKELLISSEGIVATCEENRKEHVVLSVVANKIQVYGDFKPLPTPVPTFHSKSTGARTARPSKVPTAEPTLLPTGERSGDDEAASDSLEDTRCFSARSQFRQKSRQNSDMDEC